MPQRFHCSNKNFAYGLDEQLFNLCLDVQDLRAEIRGFVCRDGAGDYWAGYATGPSKSCAGGDKDVGHILPLNNQFYLVLAQ